VISVVIPISVIKSHPSPATLFETWDSIRFHLPTAELFLTFDGVRAEQDDRYDDYQEFIRQALIRARGDAATYPVMFNEHRHQSGMLKAVINEIRTPLIMYVEADTPIVTDEPIEWENITAYITSGESNLIRLHHEAQIPAEHRHMMHGGETFAAFSCTRTSTPTHFERTSQWSQRPHIASVAYYRRILDAHFSENARCFIEDCMHGVVDNAYRVDGMNGWLQHRLHIYAPAGGNIKRSYTTDGRAGEPKYDDTQVW
jgi:hypothetical protein